MQPKTLFQWVLTWTVWWLAFIFGSYALEYGEHILWHHPLQHDLHTLFDCLADTPRVVISAAIGYKCLLRQQQRSASQAHH